MPHRICPRCQRPGRLLEGASASAWVTYYRCDVCRHVWAYDKDNENAPRRDVTVRANQEDDSLAALAYSRGKG